MIKPNLERLRDDAEYYGDYGKQFLSNSDIKKLRNDPRSFHTHEVTREILLGRYFHLALLEPEKMETIQIIDASSRNTKIYKEALEESGEELLLLNHETDDIKRLVDVFENNLEVYEMIHRSDNKFEEPGCIELFGRMFKCKGDILNSDFCDDLKTTTDINKFNSSAWTYDYDSQAYIYQKAFGVPMRFIVGCKSTFQVKVFTPTPDFLERGEQKVIDAIEVYNRFFAEGHEEDLDQRLEYVELR